MPSKSAAPCPTCTHLVLVVGRPAYLVLAVEHHAGVLPDRGARRPRAAAVTRCCGRRRRRRDRDLDGVRNVTADEGSLVGVMAWEGGDEEMHGRGR